MKNKFYAKSFLQSDKNLTEQHMKWYEKFQLLFFNI